MTKIRAAGSFVDARIFAFEPVIEPAHLITFEINNGAGAEIDLAEFGVLSLGAAKAMRLDDWWEPCRYQTSSTR